MSMNELHEKRADFVQKVQQVSSADLAMNGLELESVSLTGLDQTSIEHFNANKSWDRMVHDLLTATGEQEKNGDVTFFLANRGVDKLTMAHAVEARVPYLDHRLVEFAAGLPASVKVTSLGTKALLRRALRHDLPAGTLRRRKRAFLVPLGRWLDGDLREMLVDTLTTSAARSRGLFSPAATAGLLQAHRQGRHDHARALWTLLTLELWLRNVLDAPAAAHD